MSKPRPPFTYNRPGKGSDPSCGAEGDYSAHPHKPFTGSPVRLLCALLLLGASTIGAGALAQSTDISEPSPQADIAGMSDPGRTEFQAGTGQARVRIKDIAAFEGVRENQLVGYGLVVGLAGTGDGLRNSPFTERALQGMLERLGVGNLTEEQMRTRNTAAVMVTTMLPPFARNGSTIDVVVSSLGDATSLRGGTLIVTPLTAADGDIYAVAQGPVAVSGFSAQGGNANLTQGVPTVARIENGATVEKEVGFDFRTMQSVRLALRVPDFTTAARVEDAVNAALGAGRAVALDPGTIEIRPPQGMPVQRMMSEIERLTITPDVIAKVVIDSRTGTIVIGADVRISPVAVSQGGLTVTVEETVNVVQPDPFTFGDAVIVPQTAIEMREREAQFTVLRGDVSLQSLVDGLNAIGVTAPQTIAILQAIKAAGALHADLEII
jgi:flagellar P-ring protein FlgI